MFASVVCADAPTVKASPRIKSKFNSDLQHTLDKIPQNGVLLLLGDFNTREGVIKQGDEMWHGFVGRHGLDERNVAGEEFLQFCALNHAVDSHEHLVPKEEDLLWYLDASSNKGVSFHKSGSDEGEAEGSL